MVCVESGGLDLFFYVKLVIQTEDLDLFFYVDLVMGTISPDGLCSYSLGFTFGFDWLDPMT